MDANQKPSWERWPPNCCETCIGPWIRTEPYIGKCNKADSLEFGTTTDSRFRCPSFQRRNDVDAKAEPTLSET
jgi:hypothetical protein